MSLDSQFKFNQIIFPPALTKTGPPLYQWDFGNVAEGSSPRFGGVGYLRQPSVTFTPGFDASRLTDKTELSENTTQTLTIKVTPRENMSVFRVTVLVREDDKVKAVITSHTTDPLQGIFLTRTGDSLIINQSQPRLGTEYTYTIKIQVEPKVLHAIAFMPSVSVSNPSEALYRDTAMVNSVSYTIPDAGTWTWSAEGSYVWHWAEIMSKAVEFPSYSIISPAAETQPGRANWIPLPGQLSTDFENVSGNFALALATVLVFYLAATFFNNTVKENYEIIQ